MRHLIERIGDVMAPGKPEAVVEAGEATGLDQTALGAIDWSPLEKEIAKVLGIGAAKVKLSAKVVQYAHRGAVRYAKVDSGNLASEAGLFKAVYTEVTVEGTGEYVAKEGALAIPIDVRWTHRNGGTNGTSLLLGWYTLADKEWKFQDRSSR
jgi:hypothetical protein